MANVDPFVIQWPEKWVNDQEIGPVIHYLNRFLHDLWIRTGGGNDLLPQLQSESNRKADTLLYAVLDKVSLGDSVTIDTTGFTIDTSTQFTDLTES